MKGAPQTSLSQVKRLRSFNLLHFYTTDLRLGRIEGDGFGRNAGPEQREGLHVAPPLCNLSDGDIGVSPENLIVKRFEIPCGQTDTISSLINNHKYFSKRPTSRMKAHVGPSLFI